MNEYQENKDRIKEEESIEKRIKPIITIYNNKNNRINENKEEKREEEDIEKKIEKNRKKRIEATFANSKKKKKKDTIYISLE